MDDVASEARSRGDFRGALERTSDSWDRIALLLEAIPLAGDREARSDVERELLGAEARLSLARGRVLHADFLATRRADPAELECFERALALAQEVDDAALVAGASYGVGLYTQVVQARDGEAMPHFERAYRLAVEADAWAIAGGAARHLAFAQFADDAAARLWLDRSNDAFNADRFEPGVLANEIVAARLAEDADEAERRAQAALGRAQALGLGGVAAQARALLEELGAGGAS